MSAISLVRLNHAVLYVADLDRADVLPVELDHDDHAARYHHHDADLVHDVDTFDDVDNRRGDHDHYAGTDGHDRRGG